MRMHRLISIFVCLTIALVLPIEVCSQVKIYRQIPNDAVEKVLQSLELKYQKDELKAKKDDEKDKAPVMFFDFKRGDLDYRLHNYGSHLWIESTFDKAMTPDNVNEWNKQAKFSRLVLIEQKDKGGVKTSLSLESQLDCAGGVTDAVIKQYVNRFDEEAKKFAKFAK
jgi:Putative bacterial sensory transduction regulator